MATAQVLPAPTEDEQLLSSSSQTTDNMGDDATTMMMMKKLTLLNPVDDRFELVVLTPDSPYLKDAFDIVAESFVDEPVSIHLENDRTLRLKGWKQFVNHFVDDCSKSGMSVAYVDKANNNKVAATLIVRDFSLDLPPLLEQCLERWNDPNFASPTSEEEEDKEEVCHYKWLGPLLEVLVDVDMKYIAKAHDPENGTGDEIQPGDVVDFWMAGTHPDYRKKGLITACFSEAIILARQLGFKEAIAECTGEFSAKSMYKVGAKPIVSTEYKTFQVSNGQIGLHVDEPHTKLEILSIQL